MGLRFRHAHPLSTPAVQPRSGYATRAAGPAASPLSAVGARRLGGTAGGGGPGFVWGTTQQQPTDFGHLRRRLTGVLFLVKASHTAHCTASKTLWALEGLAVSCAQFGGGYQLTAGVATMLQGKRVDMMRVWRLALSAVVVAPADGFGGCNLERAESAEAESPPNTQLYALRSRSAANATVAAHATFAAAAGQHPPAGGGPARSPYHAATVSCGITTDAAAAASEAMDMSVSQGPIKTRLKVRLSAQDVLQTRVVRTAPWRVECSAAQSATSSALMRNPATLVLGLHWCKTC